MSRNSLYHRLLLPMAMLCALLMSKVVHADNIANPLSQKILERSQRYMETLQRRSIDLPPELRETMQRHARQVLRSWLEKLHQPDKFAQTPVFGDFDTETRRRLLEIAQSSRDAIDFLRSSPRPPSCRDVLLAIVYAQPYGQRPGKMQWKGHEPSKQDSRLFFASTTGLICLLSQSSHSQNIRLKPVALPEFLAAGDVRISGHAFRLDASLFAYTEQIQTVLRRE